MPTIGVKRDDLMKALGREYTEKEFDQLCFEFGVELDEVTSEKQQVAKEQGKDKAVGLSDDVIYKIDIPANRYDLLCLEGFVHSLKVFLKDYSAPKFVLKEPENGVRQRLVVKPSTQQVRPVAVCAILRNITITQQVYDSFIDLQDKLHQNIGRKRTLVSIGTHDLDTIQGPFVYDAQIPSDIKFVALNQTEEHTAPQLMELYKDSHLKPYLRIIEGKEKYPVIYDNKGVVMSMPPIINGDHSKIKLSTKNILIEITATDEKKANVALDTIVCLFSYHCADKFSIEPVEVEKPDGSVIVTPSLPYRTETVTVDYLNKKIGIDVSAETVADILTKMCLESHVTDQAKGEIAVTIPPTRSDILHACDIVEDVAIAYGYDNIVKTLPTSMTIGAQQLSMKLSERVRREMAGAGFTEALTFALCSYDDCGTKMRISSEQIEKSAVKISNPKTLEFQIVRTSLLPGLLKTIASNRNMALPLKLFEVQEVVNKVEGQGAGAANTRHLAAVYYNATPGFEIIHGVVDRLMTILEVSYTSDKQKEGRYYYYEKKNDDPSYFSTCCANIVAFGKVVGTLGVVHPEVVDNFELKCPVAAVEIDLEHFY